MTSKDSDKLSPYRKWRLQNPKLDFETNKRVSMWLSHSLEIDELVGNSYDYLDPWLEGKSDKEPDMLGYFIGWAKSRTLSADWDDIPIAPLSDEERQIWRDNSSLPMTVDEIRDEEAQLTWIVADALNKRFDDTIKLIKKQINALLDELDELCDKPIKYFAPTQWEEDDLGEEYIDVEDKKLDRIFVLYENIWYFEQAIESFRMLMINESNPKISLPSEKFFNGLVSVNSHKIMVALNKAEHKMKEILKFWSKTIMKYNGKPYYWDRSLAPEIFWWRHWNSQKKKSR